MDNLVSHKQAAKKRRSTVDATLCFLPLYSANFNQIKKAFSRLKTMLG